MRWIKHVTDCHDDPAIAAILEEMGLEGYAIYWLILEHLAIGIEKDSDAIPSAVHSEIQWSKICWCSTRKFRKFLSRATDLRLISVKSPSILRQFSSKSPSKRLQIDVPNLLKYRDEYSKKSGHSPDTSRARATHTQTDTDKEEKREVPATQGVSSVLGVNGSGQVKAEVAAAPPEVREQPGKDPPSGGVQGGQCATAGAVSRVGANGNHSISVTVEAWYLNVFYPVYPLHKGKEAGLKAAKKELQSQEMRDLAMEQLHRQMPELELREPSKRPYPATWINGRRWEDETAPLFHGKPEKRSYLQILNSLGDDE